MQFKLPRSDKYQWTKHAQWKMREYGLSPQRVVRVIRNPQRTEEGIVPKTIAVMQPASTRFVSSSKRGGPSSMKNKNGKKFWSQEIWAMYQTRRAGNPKSEILNSKQIRNLKFQKLQTTNQKLKIISAWRYPGVSPKNNPIPDEILDEIKDDI